MTRAGRVVLFDLDGTLTDPRPGILGCIRHALERLGLPSPPDDALVRFIGPPLRGTFAELLATADTAAIEEAMRLYRERFADVGLFENAVYEGVPEMLAHAGARVRAVYVATSKPRVYAERIVKHFGLDAHVRAVYGAELDGRHDDKAELLAHLLAREGASPEGSIMIGDRGVDMVAARANGLRAIGVLWGYGSSDELRAAGAHLLCATPRDLAAHLEGD